MIKKIISSSIIFSLFFAPMTFAAEEQENNADINAEINNGISVQAPKWEEYVPAKYRNPRDDFSRGNAIAELSVGILLTDLLLTAPIGVPMICHSTTKLKNLGYADKKIIFEEGLIEAEKITDPREKQIYYKKLLKKCKFTEQKRQRQLRLNAKAEKKANK